MAKQVRMADIAEKLGVSIVSVSKALRGKDGVSEELRRDVIRTAEAMGYIHKDSAEPTGYSIGILTSARYLARGASFYWSLYERLLTHLTAARDFGMLEVVSDTEERACSIPRLILENRVQGIIIMGKLSPAYHDMIASLRVPFTMLDTYDIGMAEDTVVSAGYAGMCEMTHYLLAKGHTKLKYVGTVGATSSISDRYFGFCRAMNDWGLTVTPDMVISDRDEFGSGALEFPEDIAETTTGLICNCDYTAYTAMQKLTAMGIRVPEDISLVGFDNYILSEMGTIGITTYAIDQDLMAQASAAQIRRRILNPDAPRQMEIVTGSLLERESVRSLK